MAIAMLPHALQDGAGSIVSAAKELGIEAAQYNCNIHWPILASKHAYEWADAMLRVRSGDLSAPNKKDEPTTAPAERTL